MAGRVYQRATLAVAIALAALILGPSSAHARSLLQSATCPADASKLSLNFTTIKESCVVPNATTPAGTQAFCDACSCALFSTFTPVMESAGVFSTSNTTAAMELGTGLITNCISSFLAQFVAAQVNINALSALGDCVYPEGTSPACMQQQIQALVAKAGAANTSTTTTPATPEPSVTAADGKDGKSEMERAPVDALPTVKPISSSPGSSSTPSTTPSANNNAPAPAAATGAAAATMPTSLLHLATTALLAAGLLSRMLQ